MHQGDCQRFDEFLDRRNEYGHQEQPAEQDQGGSELRRECFERRLHAAAQAIQGSGHLFCPVRIDEVESEDRGDHDAGHDNGLHDACYSNAAQRAPRQARGPGAAPDRPALPPRGLQRDGEHQQACQDGGEDVTERDGRLCAEVEQALSAGQHHDQRHQEPTPGGQAEGWGGLVRQPTARVPRGHQAQDRCDDAQREGQNAQHQDLRAQLVATQDDQRGESRGQNHRSGRHDDAADDGQAKQCTSHVSIRFSRAALRSGLIPCVLPAGCSGSRGQPLCPAAG